MFPLHHVLQAPVLTQRTARFSPLEAWTRQLHCSQGCMGSRCLHRQSQLHACMHMPCTCFTSPDWGTPVVLTHFGLLFMPYRVRTLAFSKNKYSMAC